MVFFYCTILSEREVLAMDLSGYPVRCRKNIRRLMRMLCTDAETAYAMMLLTATLMDLATDDNRVTEAILMDCGMEVEA